MNNLNETLNLPAIQEEPKLPAKVQEEEHVDEKATDDFELARSNLKELTDKGSWALDDLIEIAKSSQHPKAFEMVSSLIKTLADANMNLMDTHLKMKTLRQKEKAKEVAQPAGGTTNIEKAVFVGSTAEALKQLKNG